MTRGQVVYRQYPLVKYVYPLEFIVIYTFTYIYTYVQTFVLFLALLQNMYLHEQKLVRFKKNLTGIKTKKGTQRVLALRLSLFFFVVKKCRCKIKTEKRNPYFDVRRLFGGIFRWLADMFLHPLVRNRSCSMRICRPQTTTVACRSAIRNTRLLPSLGVVAVLAEMHKNNRHLVVCQHKCSAISPVGISLVFTIRDDGTLLNADCLHELAFPCS